jgi:predicted acylesterase/phospholipase RssA
VGRVGLVLAGGGARGAYEAGALSVILPELERRGERPTMYLGTSVGSLNAVALAELGTDHVAGSASIPLLFPPVRISEPARAAGWYVDGGTRLNAPIKPALDLGADRLVGFHAPQPRLGGEGPAHGEVLSLLLFDRTFAEELIRLGHEDARLWLGEPHDDGPWQHGPLGTFVRAREWTAG